MKHSLFCNVQRCEAWVRLLYLVVAAVCLTVAKTLVVLMALLQWLLFLLTREANQPLRRFGRSLSIYMFQLTRFLSFDTARCPFPFSDWPDPDAPPPSWDEDEEEDACCSSRCRCFADRKPEGTEDAAASSVAASVAHQEQADVGKSGEKGEEQTEDRTKDKGDMTEGSDTSSSSQEKKDEATK